MFFGDKLTAEAFFDIIDCPYWDDLLVSDMDTIRDVRTHPGLPEAAYNKGLALGKTFNP